MAYIEYIDNGLPPLRFKRSEIGQWELEPGHRPGVQAVGRSQTSRLSLLCVSFLRSSSLPTSFPLPRSVRLPPFHSLSLVILSLSLSQFPHFSSPSFFVPLPLLPARISLSFNPTPLIHSLSSHSLSPSHTLSHSLSLSNTLSLSNSSTTTRGHGRQSQDA